MTVKKAIWGKGAEKVGKTPSIILINPKHGRNVAVALRAASCYGAHQVWFTGNRVELEVEQKKRLPREERMKGYKDVDIIQYEYPFERFERGVVPVAVEVRKNSETLFDFEHPDRAVYVFGPEDGSIPPHLLQHCHRFVVIPTRHCLNLATAVSTILYDRALKHYQKTGEPPITPGEYEQRGRIEDLDEAEL